MKSLTPTQKKIISIIVIAVIVIIALTVFRSSSQDKKSVSTVPAIQKVEALALSSIDGSDETLNFVARVTASDTSGLSAEASGKVSKILVKEGAVVKKGQTLVRLKNSDQSIAYSQAKVQLENQQLSLEKMEKEFNKIGSSVQARLSEQQELQVKNAYQNFLNTDLQAYPEDNPQRQTGGAPIITGTYQNTEEGSYRVEVYPSGGESGASLRVSGLEKGTFTASTEFPIALGSRGLFLQFPENFEKNSTWIIDVPNKRSSKYGAAKNAYESAQAGKNLTLGQSAITKEQLQQQRNAVRQQQLSVSQAALQLDKTIIKAPFDGTIINLDISEGAIVSAFSPIGTIKTLGKLELDFSVSNRERLLLNKGDKVSYKGKVIGEISYVASSLDTKTFKNNIRVVVTDADSLTEGDTLTIEIIKEEKGSQSENRESGMIVVPLTSIQIIGNNPHVTVIDDTNEVALKPVSVGLLLGNEIEILDGLDGTELVIKDSRGLQKGQKVSY